LVAPDSSYFHLKPNTQLDHHAAMASTPATVQTFGLLLQPETGGVGVRDWGLGWVERPGTGRRAIGDGDFLCLMGGTAGRGGQGRTVRCASHVTQPLGFDRWSSDMWGHRTVRWCTRQVLFTVRYAFCACSDFCARSPRTVAHCSPFADDCWRL
jgi:hypothetical protein